MRTIKAALVGIGGMGRGHLNNYLNFMKENKGIELVAICDIDEAKFENMKVDFNLGDMANGNFDFSKFHCYTDVDEMLEKEKDVELVSVVVPTYEHCNITVKCLKAGKNVFCEKPMALTIEQCQLMIDTAKKMDKKLMIGQCLRFWGEYEVVKDYVSSGKYGKVTSAYFARSGSLPLWSYKNWYWKKELGGGAIMDQHIHDVDMVNFLFGVPKAVSSVGVNVVEGSNFDAVSTNYIYDEAKAVNTQNDWSESGKGFFPVIRINLEKATIRWDNGKFQIAVRENMDELTSVGDYVETKLPWVNPYSKEILYLADCIRENKPVEFNNPQESLNTMKIVFAEIESCKRNGQVVEIK